MLEARIEKYWTGRANGYSEAIQEDMNSFKKNAWQTVIKDYVGTDGPIKALDVGTGPGFFAVIMAELGYEVTALDTSSEMLKEAKKNAQFAGFEITTIKGDAHRIELSDGSFDLIISRNLVWTLPNPMEAYAEWYRLLNPRGKVLVFDANWYLRLSVPQLQEKYEACRQEAVKKGYSDGVTSNQHKECEELARKLPLTYEKRPEWDKKALAQCGFNTIDIAENINDVVYDERQKTMYSEVPLFAVFARK
ncbi:class I SAM-dependent methyltransferase [Desulfitibacter alkalitolerans]|uniref:class I SAM-dependent methyltransferase n=1 Tax=Desulfitibacter alkalitolerans TaxID=264641 RepID=UPI000489E038|nr:class I SAM-dependent methyltransferase [Desulfitibacter alkalitolerans]